MVNLRIIDPGTAHYLLSPGTYTITLVSFENVQNVTISAVNADWKTLASVVPGRPSKTFSVDANTIVGCYFIPKDVNTMGYLQVQLELGTTATSYEPYQEEQTITIPCTLNAIQNGSGGNVTINGQQYIADYIDFKRGKFVKIINSLILDGDKLKFVVDSTNTYWNLPQQSAVKPIGYFILSNYFKKGVFFSNEYSNFIYTTQKNMVGLFETVDELNAFVVKKYRENDPVVLYYSMQEPIETELTLEQIEQYKKLSTKAPTTIVENNYNTWMKATYKSTESV